MRVATDGTDLRFSLGYCELLLASEPLTSHLTEFNGCPSITP
jgi:hypothetical protein